MSDKQATRQAYGKALVEIGRENPNLVVMDADLSKSTMTAEFAKAFPDRFFNMGTGSLWGSVRAGSVGKSGVRQHFRHVRSRKSL